MVRIAFDQMNLIKGDTLSATSVAQVESLARGARLKLSAGDLASLTKAGA